MKVSWEAYVESLRDLLSDKDVYDPAAKQAFVRHLSATARARRPRCRPPSCIAGSPTDRAHRRRVRLGPGHAGRAHRQPRARAQVHARAGRHPERAGAGARRRGRPQRGQLPDPETYGYLLLRVQTEKGRSAARGRAPRAVRLSAAAGAATRLALVLNAEAER